MIFGFLHYDAQPIDPPHQYVHLNLEIQWHNHLQSNCHFWRSASVAYIKRGYHASGTIIRRPSVKSTIKSSSVTVTLTAIGSVSSAKVVMPCLQKLYFVLNYEMCNLIQFMSCKTTSFPPLGLPATAAQ